MLNSNPGECWNSAIEGRQTPLRDDGEVIIELQDIRKAGVKGIN